MGPAPRVLPRPRFFGCIVGSVMEFANGGKEGFQGGLDPAELTVEGEDLSIEFPYPLKIDIKGGGSIGGLCVSEN